MNALLFSLIYLLKYSLIIAADPLRVIQFFVAVFDILIALRLVNLLKELNEFKIAGCFENFR